MFKAITDQLKMLGDIIAIFSMLPIHAFQRYHIDGLVQDLPYRSNGDTTVCHHNDINIASLVGS